MSPKHSSISHDAPTGVGERYRVLLEIGRTLAAQLSAEQLYEAIYHETAGVLEASGFYISIYDPEMQLARIVFFADRGEIQRGVTLEYKGSESRVISEGVPVMISERLEEHSLEVLGDADTEPTRSAISAPMIHKGRVLGAISAQSYEAHAYTEDDLDLLQGIADIAGVAVENAFHVAELHARRQEAERIEEIGRAMAASLDPADVLGKVVDAVNSVLHVDGASVWLLEDDEKLRGSVAASGGALALPTGVSWDLSGELAETLVRRRRSVVIDDLRSSTLVPAALREHLEAGSGMAVPLVVSDKVVGVLSAGSRRVRHFSKEDLKVLERLANQASVALENARLHQDLQELSLTDPLTRLPNRRHLEIHLDKEVAAARRGRNLVVVVFDVNDFKQYNDTLGHVVGDEILRAFALLLAGENRAMNLVARYGGDEFVSVLSETNMEGASFYARRVNERVAEDPLLSKHGVTVSIGLAEFDRTSMKSMRDVLQAADMDMYQAKARKADEIVPPSRKAASP